MMNRSQSARLLPVLLAVVLVAGCSGQPQVKESIAWPPPPAEPRIVYETSITGSASLERSFWGRIGDFFFGKSTDQALGKPYGVALDGDRLIVADTASKNIIVLDFASGNASSFASLGPYGRLVEPVNVMVDRDGSLIVADTGLQKLVVFDRDGEFQRFIGGGELTAPVGMARSGRNGRLYVVDSGRHEVVVFSADDEKTLSFGGRGDMQGEFYHPLGIAISEDDTVFVVDSFHFAVQAFDLDGRFLSSFGPKPNGMGSLARPRSVAFDVDRNIYVTDALKNNVQIFDPAGQLLLEFGGMGTGPGRFRLPAGICTNGDDLIYVVDSINKRIQVFRYLPATAEG